MGKTEIQIGIKRIIMIKNPQVHFSLRITEDEKELLEKVAHREGRSINSTIRLAIKALGYLENKDK